MAKLDLYRFACNDDATIGLLFLNGRFMCYTLEDEPRAEKVAGETRIPAGTFNITLRNEGGLTKKYQDRFPDMHHGMLWLQNVRNGNMNFNWVYIHMGNMDNHTEGCLLVGNTLDNVNVTEGFLGHSKAAYTALYPKCVAAINGEGLEIEIHNENFFDIQGEY